jgi:predicted RNase H-like HicB family nuclease
MKSRFNIVIEKTDLGYSAFCPEIGQDKVTATSLGLVIDSLKSAIEGYLEQTSELSETKTNRPIWEVAQEIIQDMTEEEIKQLPTDGAEQHDHYIYGTPKQNL